MNAFFITNHLLGERWISPGKGPVKRDGGFAVSLNKLFHKQLMCWWFRTTWRLCDFTVIKKYMDLQNMRRFFIIEIATYSKNYVLKMNAGIACMIMDCSNHPTASLAVYPINYPYDISGVFSQK